MDPTKVPTSPAVPEKTGENQSGQGGADNQPAAGNPAPPAAPIFTPEQQVYLGSLISTERQNAVRAEQQRQQQEQQRQQQEQERTQQRQQQQDAIDQGKFKEAAETATKRADDLEAENKRLKHDALVSRIAAKHGLPEDLAARLQGNTEAELEADAEKLKAFVPTTKAPNTESGAGNKPNGAPQRPVNNANNSGSGGSGADNQRQSPRSRVAQKGDVPW